MPCAYGRRTIAILYPVWPCLDDNARRPHSSLGHANEFAKRQAERTAIEDEFRGKDCSEAGHYTFLDRFPCMWIT